MDFYRNHWFESIKSEQNGAFFVKKYGYKYFSGNCRICGQQLHKAADCPDKKQAPAKAWRPNGAMNKYKKIHEKKFHDKSEITCYKCQKREHYARECRSKKEKPTETFFVGCVSLCEPCVEVAWNVCKKHNSLPKHGMNCFGNQNE
jgi:hypothetical protein